MHASIAALRQCESAADCSDEGALIQNAILKRAINFPRANLAELTAAVCCDFEDNRHCSHFVRDSGGFPRRTMIQGTPL